MTNGDRPYLRHLSESDGLVTTRAEVRAGFVAMALEKNRRATPLVEVKLHSGNYPAHRVFRLDGNRRERIQARS